MGAGGGAQAAGWDFFISYTAADQEWAEWVAWQLEEAHYRVLFQAWDFVVGSHWTSRMEEGIVGAKRTVAILSRAYLESVYGQKEWQAAYRADPRGFTRKLIPVRVEDCDRPGLLGDVVSFDLFGYTEDDARQRLCEQIQAACNGRKKPAAPPSFPGIGRPGAAHLPTESPAVALPAPQETPPSTPTTPESPGQGAYSREDRGATTPEPPPSAISPAPPQLEPPSTAPEFPGPDDGPAPAAPPMEPTLPSPDDGPAAEAPSPEPTLPDPEGSRRRGLRVSVWALVATAALAAFAVIATGAGGDSGVAANAAGVAAATVAAAVLVLLAFPRHGLTAVLVCAAALVGACGGAVLFNRGGLAAVIGEVAFASALAAGYAFITPSSTKPGE